MSNTSPITTHVLDTSLGRPASGVPVTLERLDGEGNAVPLGRGVTDGDGRLRDLLPSEPRPTAGMYRLTFDTRGYFAARGVDGFYPFVTITFFLRKPDEHYHVPVLLSPYGYSTYRGS